jgi:hypothetical protein
MAIHLPFINFYCTGGEFSLGFTSDTEVTDKGWVANITCVAKPGMADTEITQFYPDFIGKKQQLLLYRVNNAGPVTRTNVPVYQVNGGTKITGIVPSMAPGNRCYITRFPTTTDMSAVNECLP